MPHFEHMSGITPDNFYDLRFIGNLNSVGGKIYFEVFRPLKEGNRYESGIYRLDGNKVVRYTAGNADRDMVADSTGEYAVFVSKGEKKSTIFLKSIRRGEEREILETDMSIKNIQWARDSKGIYILTKKKAESDDFRVIEDYPIYLNGEGFLPSINTELIYLDTRGRSRSVLKGDFQIIDFAVNPVKDELAVVVRPQNYGIYNTEMGTLDLSSGKFSIMNLDKGNYEEPGFFEDGTLFFLLNRHERSLFQSHKLAVWNGKEAIILGGEIDISLENSVNSDSRMGKNKAMRVKGDYLYHIATVQGRAGIYRIRKDGLNGWERIVGGNFSVDSFDFVGEEIYFVGQSSNSAQEIFRFNGNHERVTWLNRRIEKFNIRKPENFTFRASDGADIEGWILRGSGKGAVLEIHGGPRSSYGESFIFEFHLLNSMGFTVIFANPRGSDSYGDDFALSIKGKYGERDFKDIMELVKFVSEKYRVDEKRIGVIGGSYGGFMVNWIIGHTDIFRAAVTDRSISDQVSFYFSSDIGPEFNGDQIGGNPFENLDHFWEKSPLKHVRNCRTPLLIVHSDEDFRCPIWQAYELYTQLKLQGSKVRMISFRGENHDLSREGKPGNRVKRLEEISGWFVENLTKEN
jgi:dipeptidyl aminopeptidase/acylaminoacyl peptidase